MKTFHKIGLAAIAFAAALSVPSLLLAADRPDSDKGCICMDLYQPVCAKLPSGEKKTFSNACFAKCAKAILVHEGAC